MLADFFEDFLRLTRLSRPDGLGGTVEDWQEGDPFRGGVTAIPGGEIDVAGQREMRMQPVLVHETSVGFEHGDLVRRAADGAVYRIVGAPMATPAHAAVRFRQAAVERVIP